MLPYKSCWAAQGKPRSGASTSTTKTRASFPELSKALLQHFSLWSVTSSALASPAKAHRRASRSQILTAQFSAQPLPAQPQPSSFQTTGYKQQFLLLPGFLQLCFSFRSLFTKILLFSWCQAPIPCHHSEIFLFPAPLPYLSCHSTQLQSFLTPRCSSGLIRYWGSFLLSLKSHHNFPSRWGKRRQI